MGPCEEMIQKMVHIRKQCRIPEGWVFVGPDDFVLKNGHRFGFRSPDKVEIGEQKMCYKNAFELMLYKKHTYVEGYAQGYGLIPVQHAWTLDGEGRVVESTWSEPAEDYYGVEFKRDYVLKQVLGKETYGIFWPDDMANFELMKATDEELKEIINGT